MEFKHCCHPLILNNEQVKDEEVEEEDKGVVICVWCDKPILGPSFCCRQCKFVRHTICDDPPWQIKHPYHPQHALTFLEFSPYKSRGIICDNCRQHARSFYHCPLCQFDLDMSCAFDTPTIKHTSHEHPLMLLQRPAKFKCDACGVELKDQSYVCHICQFWIHKSCALLPKMLTRSEHDHSLTLVYSFTSLSNYSPMCDICTEKVDGKHWVYSCSECRYIVHVKCRESMPRGCQIEDSGANVNQIHLPIDNCLDVIRTFVNEAGLRDHNPTDFGHFSHEHPLKLFEEYNNKMENDTILLCDGCSLPIVAPFYSCAQCTFSLHKCCVELPQEVHQHPCHPEHSLFLITSHLFECSGCRKLCFGFAFNCNPCKFYLDVRCASLLNSTIAHQAHKHTLVPREKESRYRCNACGRRFDIVLECRTCDFYLHSRCALLPHTIRHRWDEHPFVLSFPPFTYHPEEFYCEFCEDEIDPNHWMYSCQECDQSFHPRCIINTS